MPQPTKNTLTADTRAQKNFSWLRPNGCSASGPPRPRSSPTLSRTWFPTSASEWTVSANSVGEPVRNQPKPLAIAMAVLVAIDMETELDIAIVVARSAADLARPEHDPLATGQSFEADGAAGVKLVGRDADFGAEAVLEAVGEAGRGIDHHRARVDLAQEAHRVRVVLGHDRVGVLRTVARDVVDRHVERIDDPDGDDRREVLGVPVVLGRRLHFRNEGARALAAPHLDTLGGVDRCERRQHARRDVGVHQQ